MLDGGPRATHASKIPILDPVQRSPSLSLLLLDNLWFTWLTLAPQRDVPFCSLFSRDIKRESVSSTGLILIDRNTSEDLVEICVRI